MMRLLHICFVNVYVSANYGFNFILILFSTDLNLSLLTPQTAIFGFLAETSKCTFEITNHILLIFKMYIYIYIYIYIYMYIYMYIYINREKCSADIRTLINEIRKIKTLEKNITTNALKSGNLQ